MGKLNRGECLVADEKEHAGDASRTSNKTNLDSNHTYREYHILETATVIKNSLSRSSCRRHRDSDVKKSWDMHTYK